MALSVGSKAPDFTLVTRINGQNEKRTLSDNFGRHNTVLLFYPGAFTGVCHQEMCDFTAGLHKYNELNAHIYGVSRDTPFSLEAWQKSAQIGFPLLSDYKGDVARAYEVEIPDFAGLGPGTARAVFVIDKGGVIRYSEQTEKLSDLPNYEAVENAVRHLEVEPAGR